MQYMRAPSSPANRNRRRLVVAALAAWCARAAALSATDTARVERLIEHVGAQAGIRFVRNGEEFDAPSAARHLRMKLERAGERVRTVDEFIDGVASRSWLSGRPYLVRLPDGRELQAADWLRGELRRIEAGKVGAR